MLPRAPRQTAPALQASRPAGGRPHRRRRGRRPAGQGGARPARAARRPRRRHVRADRAADDAGRAGLPRGAERLREGVRVRRERQPRSAHPRSSGWPTAWPTSSCARTPTTRRCGWCSPSSPAWTPSPGRARAPTSPGELDGDLVSAAQVRELAYQFGLLPRPAAEPTAATTADSPTPLPTADSAEAHDEHEARLAALRDAERAAAEDLLAARAAGERRGPTSSTTRDAGGAHPPAGHPPADRHRARRATAHRGGRPAVRHPARAHRQHRAPSGRRRGTRTRTTDAARMPTARPTPCTASSGCAIDAAASPAAGIRARCCDLDHQVPHPHGATAHDNLACLCEHHHRLSHQAPGWRLHRDADGSLVWTLPGGRTVTTYPPAFGTDDGSTPASGEPAPRTGRQRYDDRARRDQGQPAGPAGPPTSRSDRVRHALGRSTDVYGLG